LLPDDCDCDCDCDAVGVGEGKVADEDDGIGDLVRVDITSSYLGRDIASSYSGDEGREC
jgi:hypothetical protein